nr:immunoglobulin light chain junction region [Macaca mulatta]MOX47914.1 immunoglobulin light chain junction region [Macaca mulatta]MOX47927.1 immunoglobulin light chain junction region [Macaca mulatta]MOX48133.1 immunoglobulin light chain junction region [Macaca mulatta]MOX48393.1 immunoglobulin light chain junction region [Macaca mulatta]
CQQEHNWPRTF